MKKGVFSQEADSTITTKNPADSSGKKSGDTVMQSFRETVKSTFWAFKLMYKIAPWDVIALFVIAVASSILPTLNSYFYARMMDEIIKIVGQRETYFNGFNFFSLSSLLSLNIVRIYLVYTVVGLVKDFVRRSDRYLSRKLDKVRFPRIDDMFFEKMSNLDLQHYEDKDIANLITKSQSNLWRLRDSVRTVREFLVQILSAVVAGIICFKVSPAIAFFTIIASIPDSVVFYKFTKLLNEFYEKRLEDMRKRGWLRSSYTSEGSVIENKITKAFKYLHNMASSLNMDLAWTEMKIYKRRFVNENTTSVLNTIAWMVSGAYLLFLAFTGQISIGDLTFYSGKFGDFGNYLSGVAGYINDLFDASVYLKSIREVFSLKPRIVSGTLKMVESSKPPRIEFKDVWFKYPATKKYVLKNINFVIEPSDEIALVGHNGAGKTTLLNLLLRFYDPTKGEILVDGVNLKELDLDDYYNKISNLAQSFNAFGVLDAKSNIGIGRPLEEFDMGRIKDAAVRGDADEFIQKFDKKYDQVLSKAFTDGTKLSGGQWQKLALSRMFYRDTPILILDEPTSAIDAEAEFKIFQRIYEFLHDKTVIIVSHRFSTVRNAKKIYVLTDGEIVERGSHDDLMKLNGKYARAFSMQAKGYEGKVNGQLTIDN